MYLATLNPPCSHGVVSLVALQKDSLEQCGQLDADPYWPMKCDWEPLPEAGRVGGHLRTVENIPFLLSILGPCFLPCCQESWELTF